MAHRHDPARGHLWAQRRQPVEGIARCALGLRVDRRAGPAGRPALRSHRAGEVIEDAAWEIERREGSLLCINVSAESRACLSAAGNHAVLMDDESLRVSLR